MPWIDRDKFKAKLHGGARLWKTRSRKNKHAEKVDDMNKRASLPSDVIILIIQQLDTASDRATLKACRYVNRVFCEASTPRLFYSLDLNYSMESRDKANQILANPDLSRHVRQLVFHDGTWARSKIEFEMVKLRQHILGLKESKEDISQWQLQDRGWPQHSVSCDASKLSDQNLNLIKAIRDEVLFWQTCEQSPEAFFPKGQFENLENIFVSHRLADSRVDESKFQLKKFGCSQIKTRPMLKRTSGLLNFLTHFSYVRHLKVLNLQNIGIACFLALTTTYMDESGWSSRLEKLRVLRIRIDLADKPWHEDRPVVGKQLQQACDGLGRLFKACASSVTELSYQGGHQSHNAHATRPICRIEQMTLTQVLLQNHFPQLRKLTLDDFASSEESFLNFMALHGPTLKYLSIRDWSLFVDGLPRPDITIKISTSSVVRTLCKIATLTHLTNVELRGIFKTFNERGQDSPFDWRCDPRASSEKQKQPLSTDRSSSRSIVSTSESPMLLDALKAYIVHDGPFPFSEAVQSWLETDMHGIDIGPQTRELIERWAGHTWTWTFDGHPDVTRSSDDSFRFIDCTAQWVGSSRASPYEIFRPHTMSCF